jgi:hypothetical protein
MYCKLPDEQQINNYEIKFKDLIKLVNKRHKPNNIRFRASDVSDYIDGLRNREEGF